MRPRPAGQELVRRRPRRPDPEDRERHLARVPRRPDLDRGRRRDPGAGHRARLREDVREPPFFVDKLVSMGARIILCDPHRVVVTGPARLYGQRLESPDIRAGMAMVIAALCAEGTSTIGNIGQIDRGYERIDERLRALGAAIERVERSCCSTGRSRARSACARGRGTGGGERGDGRAHARPPARRARPRRRLRPRRSRSSRTTPRRRSTRRGPLSAGARGPARAAARTATAGVLPADEALAPSSSRCQDAPLVASNADLTGAGGLGSDLAARSSRAGRGGRARPCTCG